jgi:hypothetical protein
MVPNSSLVMKEATYRRIISEVAFRPGRSGYAS